MGKTLLSILYWSILNIFHLSHLNLLNLYRRYAPGVQFQILPTVLLRKNVPGVHHILIVEILAAQFIGNLFRVQIVITSIAPNNCPSIRRKWSFPISCVGALYYDYCHDCLYFHSPSTQKKYRANIRNDFSTNIWKINQNKRIWKILTSACASELQLHSALPGCCPRSTAPP